MGAHQVQINEGDVLPLSNGSFIQFKASQTSNTREALKFSHYSLNHVLLLKQDNFNDWNMKLYSLTIDCKSPIELTFISPLLKVKTAENTYFIDYPDNTFVYVSSDDNSLLYKLTRHGDLSSVQLIGYNSNPPLLITNKR